ncbi:pentapeptide repeat-containing protein [Amycolatopsis sp. NPDC006131]|uniref:pentapeptide repeat-containing protein n=1 Tax=Amycolatopsis sp. NPDC006131 TaxID=3156731 RepID=UPI0033BBABAA
MAERRHGTPAPATGSTVTGQDWEGAHLSGERHERVAFVRADLSEAVTEGAVFTECTFRDSRFNASRHTGAAFLNCTFTGCSFFDATFTDCKTTGSMFDRCTFDLLTAEGGDWSFTGLPGADLRRASFSGVRLREADLTGARIGGTVHRCDLSGAWLHAADLSGCDLRGSEITGLNPLETKLAGATIDPEQALVLASALGVRIR